MVPNVFYTKLHFLSSYSIHGMRGKSGNSQLKTSVETLAIRFVIDKSDVTE